MLYSDQPITKIQEDQLSRGDYARHLAASIYNSESKETAVLGLFGNSGSGKTSLIHLMLAYLQQFQEKQNTERIKTLWFQPSLYQSEEQMTADFLLCLASVQNEEWQSACRRYMHSLLPKRNLSFFAKLHRFFFTHDDTSLKSCKETLSNLLENSAFRLLIIIDDFDKLTKEQSESVIHLLKDIANFPHITYLLASDSENLSVRKKEINSLIHLSLFVPPIQQETLEQMAKEAYQNVIETYHLTNSDNTPAFKDLWDDGLKSFIHTVRDMKRLFETMAFSAARLSGQACGADLFLLTGISLCLPEVYDWMSKNEAVLTGKNDYPSSLMKEPTAEQWRKRYLDTFRQLCHKEQTALTAMHMMAYLFPHFGRKIGMQKVYYGNETAKSEGHICHPDHFSQYFAMGISEHKNSEIHLSLSKEELVKEIKELSDSGTFGLFDQAVHSQLFSLTQENSENIIHALAETSEHMEAYDTSDLAVDVLTCLSKDTRSSFLQASLQQMTSGTSGFYSAVLIKIKTAYQNQTDLKYRVITEPELKNAEEVYCREIRRILGNTNLFDLPDYISVYNLLRVLDHTYLEEQAKLCFDNQIHIVKYTELLIGNGQTGDDSSRTFYFRTSIPSLLDEKEIFQAVSQAKSNQAFYTLPLHTQYAAAAYYLMMENNSTSLETNIYQSDVENILASWKLNTEVYDKLKGL